MRRAAAALRRNAEATSEAVLGPGVVEFVSEFKMRGISCRGNTEQQLPRYFRMLALGMRVYSPTTQNVQSEGAR
jgi:hypothetical protein